MSITHAGQTDGKAIYLGPNIKPEINRYYDLFPNTNDSNPVLWQLVSSVGVLVHEMIHASGVKSDYKKMYPEQYAKKMGIDCVDTHMRSEIVIMKAYNIYSPLFDTKDYKYEEKLYSVTYDKAHCLIYSKFVEFYLRENSTGKMSNSGTYIKTLRFSENPNANAPFLSVSALEDALDLINLYIEEKRPDLKTRFETALYFNNALCSPTRPKNCDEAQIRREELKEKIQLCGGELGI